MRVLIAAFILLVSACDTPPPAEKTDGSEAAPAAAMPAPATGPVPSGSRPGILVDARWLHENLQDPGLRILELGQSYEEYLQAHIPNALYLDWLSDITDPEKPEQYLILSSSALEELMGRLGVSRDSLVVLYDTLSNRLSTRMYWTLRYYGHEQVRILDGGVQAWERAGYEFTGEVPEYSPVAYRIDRINEQYRVDRLQIESRLHDDDFILIDGRPREQYTGDAPGTVFHTGSTHLRKGHIYGAINIPWHLNFNADGTFKSVDQLRELYELRGVRPGHTIVTYCNEGLHAAPPWFVLKELLGYKDVRLYDASLAEWANLDDTRMSRGRFCM